MPSIVVLCTRKKVLSIFNNVRTADTTIDLRKQTYLRDTITENNFLEFKNPKVAEKVKNRKRNSKKRFWLVRRSNQKKIRRIFFILSVKMYFKSLSCFVVILYFSLIAKSEQKLKDGECEGLYYLNFVCL